ncbi:MAG: hypothetical protein LH632_07700 [Rhodoferax sp.]|nr:hypothetical protein [Rhodoferax sp.]
MDRKLPLDQLEAALHECERCQQVVASTLLQGQPDLLAAAAAGLQAATCRVALLLPAVSREEGVNPKLRRRLLQAAQTLGMHREACLRRSGVVQRALHSILPTATGTTTYGSGTGLYGNQARQSGAFKVLSA